MTVPLSDIQEPSGLTFIGTSVPVTGITAGREVRISNTAKSMPHFPNFCCDETTNPLGTGLFGQTQKGPF
ncbi:hypothetical protein GCM10008957_07060 [Deinococcus ruber]|uniref:Uncharacterized protein n=1 Tax=Deinococcus ruber TaxID=1848197 RepID=A0A918F1X5_9DEIO|nr:hypothetical protein GCM10008957_07060 [Deinococcus ruber]